MGDPLSRTIADPLHSEAEDRFVILGQSHRRRLVVVVFTERGENIRIVSAGRRHCDRGGAMAAKGTVDRGLLKEMLRHPFLRRRPPKSTGRENTTEHISFRGGGLEDPRALAER